MLAYLKSLMRGVCVYCVSWLGTELLAHKFVQTSFSVDLHHHLYSTHIVCLLLLLLIAALFKICILLFRLKHPMNYNFPGNTKTVNVKYF